MELAGGGAAGEGQRGSDLRALSAPAPHPRVPPAARGPSSCLGALVSRPLGVQPSPCFLTRPLPHPGLPRAPSLQALPCTLSVPGDSLPSLDPRPFPYTLAASPGRSLLPPISSRTLSAYPGLSLNLRLSQLSYAPPCVPRTCSAPLSLQAASGP